MTAGSAMLGQIASRFGTPTSLVVATLGMVLASATVFLRKLGKIRTWNSTSAASQLDGVREIDLPNERRPGAWSHEHIIDPQNTKRLPGGGSRAAPGGRRAGAMSWAVQRRYRASGLFIETFLRARIEHLRQQERHTTNDLLLQSRVLAFHQAQHHRQLCHRRAGITITTSHLQQEHTMATFKAKRRHADLLQGRRRRANRFSSATAGRWTATCGTAS